MFSHRLARQATTTITTTTKQHISTANEAAIQAAATGAPIGTSVPRVKIQAGEYKTKYQAFQKKEFDKLVQSTYERQHNYAQGKPNYPVTHKLRPVYPFRPHAVHPVTGDYVVRPGKKQPGVLDVDTTLSSQILHYKRRMVNNKMAVQKPENVIGDEIIYQSRVESNRERLTVFFDDNVRPFLNRQTRQSPIYRDTTPELRTPRVPLPADTHTMLSPTAGVLHAYRMHWIRMYLNIQKRQQLWKKNVPFSNVYDYDANVPTITGANNAGLQEFMYMIKGVAAARNSNFVGADTAAFIAGVKKILPIVAKVDKVEVIKIRRRKK